MGSISFFLSFFLRIPKLRHDWCFSSRHGKLMQFHKNCTRNMKKSQKFVTKAAETTFWNCFMQWKCDSQNCNFTEIFSQKRCVLDWTLGNEISAWNSLSNKHFPLVSPISIAFMYFQKTIRHLVFPICNHCQYKYFFCWCKRLPLGYADISLRIISVRLSVDILLFINENANEMGR